MLQANTDRVKLLTPMEIWLFIIGRSLIAFAVGILAMLVYPHVATKLAIPAALIGLVCLTVAARGMFRDRHAPGQEPAG
jgi:membrane protein implicated in regulation of membrane protease activity